MTDSLPKSHHGDGSISSFLLPLLVLLVGLSGAHARLTVTGTVFNQQGNPVPLVVLRWMDARENVVETASDSSGAYVVVLPASTAVEEHSGLPVPEQTQLLQNYPNPFNPSTKIPFRIAGDSDPVSVTIFNALGQKARTLFSGRLAAGDYEIYWDGATDGSFTASAGMYLAVLRTENAISASKMIRLDGGVSTAPADLASRPIGQSGKLTADPLVDEGITYTVELSGSRILDRIVTLLVADTEAIDFSVDERFLWTPKAPMPTPRQEIVAATHDGLIYVFGGLDDDARSLDLVDTFDPATDSWSARTSLPVPLNHLAAATVGERIYILGGYISFSPREISRQTWQYDPVDDTWTGKADMPFPRAAHGAVVVDGLIYVVGGVGDDETEGQPMIYDSRIDTWRVGVSMPVKSEHLAVAAANGEIFAISGRFGAGRDEVQAYSPENDRWELRSRIPTPRSGITAISWMGQIYVFGGELPGVFAENEVYDPVGDHWSAAPPMPTARHGLASALVDGKLYLIGGGTIAGLQASSVVEEYVP